MAFNKALRREALKLWLSSGLQNFLQGLVVLAPSAVTLWAVFSLFNTVDNLLPNFIHSILPDLVGKDSDGNLKKIPGLGFVVVIGLVIFVGRVSSMLFFGKLMDFLNGTLERTPGIKFIFSSVKDLLEAFAGNKKKFDKPVLINMEGPDVWRIAFLTQPTVEDFGLEGYVAVYVPNAYSISGKLVFVPAANVKPLKNISAAEAMKFAISGGVTEV